MSLGFRGRVSACSVLRGDRTGLDVDRDDLHPAPGDKDQTADLVLATERDRVLLLHHALHCDPPVKSARASASGSFQSLSAQRLQSTSPTPPHAGEVSRRWSLKYSNPVGLSQTSHFGPSR